MARSVRRTAYCLSVIAPRCRNLTHEAVEPDCIGRDHRIALLHYLVALHQGKAAQRRNGLIQAFVHKRRGERVAKMFARLLEHEQRDWFRRQQSGVNDQRLGCTVKLSGLVDGEREGLRHRQPIMILRRCIARVVEQSRRRGFKSTAVLDQGHFEPLAIGGRLLVRERQAAQRL